MQYKYFILFPLSIVEGPIIAIIAGFLCTTHFLNPVFVFPVIVIGDITGDSLCYLLGRVGLPVFLKRMLMKLGMKPENIQQVRTYFDTKPNRMISLSKITLGIGFTGIYIAGNTRIPYRKFIIICLATSALQYMIYLSIGLLFGNAYLQISSYLNLFTALVILTAFTIFLFLLIKAKRKNI